MIKKLFVILYLSWPCVVFGMQICGPSITSTEISYTPISKRDASDTGDETTFGYWAVGGGCIGATDIVGADEVANMCETVTVGGIARCVATTTNSERYWTNFSFFCECTRTHATIDGALNYSYGMPTIVAYLWSSKTCSSTCAQVCAKSVAINANGMRAPIMLLGQ